MRLLLDTQILVWMVNGDSRLRTDWIAAISDTAASLHVSAVVAFEYTDLQLRKRIPTDEPMEELVQRFDLTMEGYPADCWRLAAALPQIHRDPIDRMLVAHALAGGFTLATADTNIRKYPVTVL